MVQNKDETVIEQPNFLKKNLPIKIPRFFFEINNRKSLFFLSTNILIILSAGPLSYWLAAWWGYVLAFVAVTIAGDALLKLQHEAMHRILVKNKALNASLGKFISALMGTRYYDATTIHMRHHACLGGEDDPNLYWYGEKSNLLAFMIGQLLGAKLWMFFYRMIMLVTCSIFPRWSVEINTNTSLNVAPVVVNRSRGIDDLLMLILVQGVLLILITLISSWWIYALFIVLPPSTLGSLLESIRSYSEHARSKKSACNIAEQRRFFWVQSNSLELTILSQFGFHYHHLHHLYPSIPVFNLPRLHSWLMKEFGDYQEYFVLRESYIKTLLYGIIDQKWSKK